MLHCFRGLTLVLGLILATGQSHAQEMFLVTDQPSWVQEHPRKAVAEPPLDEIQDGSYTRLLDRQINASLDPIEAYSRTVVQIVNEEGVRTESQISVVFDPTYQQLLLHSIRVHRNGVITECLDPTRVQVFQRETRLEYQIYDGAHTAVMILDDIRPGDRIETRYTLRGQNPAYRGHFSNVVYTRGEYFLSTFHFRLLWPETRTLHTKSHNTDLKPTRRRFRGGTEYSLDLADVRPLGAESYLPAWFDPYSWIQFSDYGSWKEIVDWGKDLYRPDPIPSPLVRKKADEIMAAHSSPQDRVLAAVQFVQDEIRYLGIELGTSSHQPAPPTTVLQRRFGDCKDKSVLLVSMLKAMDISAAPALVSSTTGLGIENRLPTLSAFDHVITRIELADRFVWVDPTDQYRRGKLDGFSVPLYGRALVLDGSEEGLSSVEPAPESRPLTRTEKTYVVGDPDDPVKLTIKTIADDNDADNFRSFLKSTGRKSLQDFYLEYYAAVYPQIKVAKDLTIEDDEVENRLVLTEAYTIPGFWELSPDKSVHVATFFAEELQGNLPRPTDSPRTMPIGISYPMHMSSEWKIHLDDIMVTPDSEEIQNLFFRFNYRAGFARNTLTLNYELETYTDHVSPEHAEAYLADVDKVEETLGYEIVAPAEAAVGGLADFNLSVTLLVMLVLAGSLWLAVRYYRRLPVSPPIPVVDKDMSPAALSRLRHAPSGIGGWLLLLAIGITLSPLRIFVESVEIMDALSLSNWVRLTTPGGPMYHPAYAPILIFEACLIGPRLVAVILLVVLFYQKRRIFPKFYIALLVASLLLIIVDSLLVMQIPAVAADSNAETLRDVVSILLSLLIWGTYLLRSRRARATFVR